MRALRALALAATLAAVCVLPALAGSEADPDPCDPGTLLCTLAAPQSVQVNPHPLNADGTAIEVPASGALAPVEVVVPMPAPGFVDPMAQGQFGGSSAWGSVYGPYADGALDAGGGSGDRGSGGDPAAAAGVEGGQGGPWGAAQALAMAGLAVTSVAATASQGMSRLSSGLGRWSSSGRSGAGSAGRGARLGGYGRGGLAGGGGSRRNREDRLLPRADWLPGSSTVSSGWGGAGKSLYAPPPPTPKPEPSETPTPPGVTPTASSTPSPAQGTITPVVTPTPPEPPGYVAPVPPEVSGKTIGWLGRGVKFVRSVSNAVTASAIQFVALESGKVGVRVGPAVASGSKIAFRTPYGFAGTHYNPSTIGSITGRGLLRGALSKGPLGISAVTSLAANLLDYGLGKNKDKGILSPEFAASTMVDYGLAAGAGLLAAGGVAIVGGLATAGLVALGATFTAPLWLAVGATAAVGLVIGLALDHFGVGDSLKAKVVDGFKAWGGISNNVKVIGGVMAERATSALRQSRDAIVAKAQDAGKALGGFVGGLAASVTSGVRKVASDAKSLVRRAGDTVVKTAQGVGKAVTGFVGGVLGKAKDSVERLKGSVISKLPKVSLPKVSLPKITLPKVSLPKVSLPKITLPKVSLPKISLPKISLPKVSLPKVSAPKISWPKLSGR